MALPKRPTDLAKVFFDRGFEESLRARHALDFTYTQSDEKQAMFELIQSVGSIARGLTELSTGIRAIYMAVESIGGTADGKPAANNAVMDGMLKNMMKGFQAAQEAHGKLIVKEIINTIGKVIPAVKKMSPI